jgi:hypothetical protein
MVRAYKPGEMEKLFQVFAYYSTANPAGLPSMEKTLGYAIPILQSGADIDPKDVMALSTVLATSGVTSSKAGTWLREFGVRAMPGNAKHNELLTRLGLLDAEGKPTWYTNGKPDLPKALSIAGPRAAAMPPEERLPLEMELFGGGAFAVLGGDVAQQRYRDLRAGQENPANIARYNAFNDAMMGTTRGVAKSTLQEFNVAMIELGTSALPIATAGLRVISGVLHGLNFIQGATPKGDRRHSALMELFNRTQGDRRRAEAREAIFDRRADACAADELPAGTAADYTQGDADRVFVQRRWPRPGADNHRANGKSDRARHRLAERQRAVALRSRR